MILVASSWLADTMRSRTSSGFAYREKIPSRFRTASPPSRPISIASLGPTTPSMAAAMIGSSKRWPQSSQAMSTSFGLIVTVPGTRAMSSNPYATLAFRPRPTHIPIGAPPLSQSPVPSPRSPYIGIGLVPAYYISYEYTRRPPRVSTRGRRGVRFLVEDAEPHEPQVVVHALDRARDARDEHGEAAGPDHLGAPAHLRPHPVDEPVHEAGEAVDRAGLDVGRRVTTDGLLGPDELDPVEAGRTVHERIDRRPETGCDRATDELAPRVHAVERRRGAEVDDNDRRPIQNARGDRVHIAVGADLTRRVHVERHPRVHSRLDDERRLAEVLLAHPLERLLDGWHDVRDGDAVDVARRDPARPQEGLDEHAVLVSGLLPPAREDPGHEEPVVIEDADLRVRVADVSDEQHALPPTQSRPRRSAALPGRRPPGARRRRRGRRRAR